MYLWQIKWKDYNDPPLTVSEKQAKFIDAALEETEEKRGKYFKINGEKYSYSDVRQVVKTNKPVNDTKMLYQGEADDLNESALINEEGDVVASWYKRMVTNREYESYYSRHHAYKLVSRDNGELWVACRVVEKVNGIRPEHLEPCTESEARMLWKTYSQAAS